MSSNVLICTSLVLFTPLLYVYTAARPCPYFIMSGASIRLLIVIGSVRRLGKGCDVFTSRHTRV
jgi:hypothetical protein